MYSASDSQPYISVEYLRTNGEDSISKYFSVDKLTKIYETKYDSQNRIIYYGLKDLQADPTYDQSFEWTYEYRDSITNKSKIVIQTIFNTNKKGGKDFHFRVLSEYDNKNRKVKDTRESEPSDPMAQITAYKYDDKDSLIEEKTDGITVDIFNKHINEPCNKEINRQLKTSDYTSIKNLVKKILSEIKETINSSNCKTLVYKYNSSDKQIQLIVRKVQPYWEGGRNVSLIKIETL